MRRLIVLLIAVALAACATTNELPIEGKDTVGFGALRVKRDIEPNWAIELEASHASGSDKQSVPSGFVIDVGDVVSGPADIESDVALTSVSLSGVWRLLESTKLVTEVPFGATYIDIDLEVDGSGVRLADERSSFGPHIGARFIYSASERVQVYGHYGHAFGLTDDLLTLVTVELGLIARLADPISIFGGFRYWEVDDENLSGIDYQLYGPIVGIELRL